MFTLIVTTMLSFNPTHVPSHIEWGWNNQNQAKAMVLGSDLLIGCFKSGLGSDDGFLAGCAQGAFGGGVLFAGQIISTHAMSQNHVMPFPAIGKIVQDFGLSIQDNVMRSNGMFDSYQTDLAFASIRIGKDPGIRFSLVAAAGIGASVIQKDRFDWKTSLYFMSPVFEMHDAYRSMHYEAYTIGNTITYSTDKKTNLVFSHELVHVSQFSQLRFANDLVIGILPKDVPAQSDYMFRKLFQYWTAGQDMGMGMLAVFQSQFPEQYWNGPNEIEAYYLERNSK